MPKYFCFLIFILFFSHRTQAQKGLNLKWESEFSYTQELPARWSANAKAAFRQTFFEPSETGTTSTYNFDFSEIQTFLTYETWNTIKLSVGYNFRLAELLENPLEKEHRIMQQLAFVTYPEGIRLSHRFRTEQRFQEEGFINRWRYRLSFEKNLNGTQLDPGEKYLVTSNEILYSFNGNKNEGENRIYIGLGWFFNSTNKLETGFQYRLAGIGNQIENSIFLTTAYYLSGK